MGPTQNPTHTKAHTGQHAAAPQAVPRASPWSPHRCQPRHRAGSICTGLRGPSLSSCLLPSVIYLLLLGILHLLPFYRSDWWLPGNGFAPVTPQQRLKRVKISVIPLLPLILPPSTDNTPSWQGWQDHRSQAPGRIPARPQAPCLFPKQLPYSPDPSRSCLGAGYNPNQPTANWMPLIKGR